MFSEISPEISGVSFNNRLDHTERLNAYTYRNFYNGAGVALGDINNDGLLDIYFSGNQVANKLYLNKGDFQFEDITQQAGVACENVWSTGVSMADVNGDGLLDIFVCKSGPPFGGIRHNELFINNGDLTFTESSKQYGIADEGLSIHAVFFDFDNDNDLDFYLLNNSNRSVGIYDLKKGQREVRDPFGGNKLYRNDGSSFTDVSQEAGIFGSAIGFGLGVTVSDVNLDGWMDLFISNDFFERDYLYINNKDGTFSESLETAMSEISMGSMGADIADLNNDGFPEIFVTEMLPESIERVRTKAIFEDWNKYSQSVDNGYFRQFSRNVLQLNNGYMPVKPESKHVSFSEIGRFSGVSATDWSWGALIFDFNNDGAKDIFVANGIPKDLTDQDYINYYANSELNSIKDAPDSFLLTRLIDRIPSVPLENYLFKNNGDLTFQNIAIQEGVGKKTFSNGAAYGDLDNDGAVDLVVSNINAPASIYKNNSRRNSSHTFIGIRLKGKGRNTSAFGTKVRVHCGVQTFFLEQSPVKGYLSSVDHTLHTGLGETGLIDSLVIAWPDGTLTRMRNVGVNQILSIDENHVEKLQAGTSNPDSPKFFSSAFALSNETPKSTFVDFNRDKLLFEMISNEGRRFTEIDFNNDGLIDIFLGGGAAGSPVIYEQKPGGTFEKANTGNSFINDAGCEDADAVAIDVNGDGLSDLFVCSGGNKFAVGAAELKDRLYINLGKGRFRKEEKLFKGAQKRDISSFALATDFNGDGKQDLIVGSRAVPFAYGVPANMYLYQNIGDGFEDVTSVLAPEFLKLGMLRDAVMFDFDNDGDEDIAVCGEWMSIVIFENIGGRFRKTNFLNGFSGLWNTIEVADVNSDGWVDLVAGNNGLNSKYRTSETESLVLYINDFDRNGSLEHIICQKKGDKVYPFVLLSDLVKQIPTLRKKFTTFQSYADKEIYEVFDEAQLKQSIVHTATELRSMVFLNNGGKGFVARPLPSEAQFTKIYAVHPTEIDGDGTIDLVLGGNHYKIKPELGIQSAGVGLVLRGIGNGDFSVIQPAKSGIFENGEIRDIIELRTRDKTLLLFLKNEDSIRVYEKIK